MPEKNRMKMGELAARSGVPRHMIHYYLNQGVLHPPEKVNRTTAYYDDSHLERLMIIKKIKKDFHSPLAFIFSRFGEDKSDKSRLGPPPSGPAGRKSPSREGETKERIMNAAINLFGANGFHQTSIKDITDHLGFSTGTFYRYFDGKQDLFNQVVAKGVKQTVDEVESSVQKETDFLLRNTKRLEALRNNYHRLSEILTQLRAGAVHPETPVGDTAREIYYELAQPFLREIRQARELGMIRPVDPDLLVFCLIGMCDMLLLRSFLDNKYDLNQIVEFIFGILLNGLRPSPEIISEP